MSHFNSRSEYRVCPSCEEKQLKGRRSPRKNFESFALLTMPLLTTSGTLRLFPSSCPVQLSVGRASAASKASSFAGSFHHRVSDSISVSFSRSFPWFSSLIMPSPRLLASISSSAVLSGSGGGGRDGLTGGSGGGGGDGGSSGQVAATGPLVGETEEDPALESDIIFLSVGGMTCGGCAASVKRILESQPQVASATVYLEKEIAVVSTVPEAKDTENWQQLLGEKLANHLTACGFKSEFQEEGNLARRRWWQRWQLGSVDMPKE